MRWHSDSTRCVDISHVFKALYVDGDDLRNQPESVRIDEAEPIVRWLVDRDSQRFELVPTARTEDEKRSLVALQEEESREGEVWVAHDCRYVGGKQNGATAPYLRTKHAVPLEVVVLDLTPSKADGRHFASAEVGVYDGPDIVSLGCVGSGFSQDDQAKLARLHSQSPRKVVITIKTRGFTHLGKVQHASFEGFSDTAPEACRR
jgi:ATP-dependent DNA ligase